MSAPDASSTDPDGADPGSPSARFRRVAAAFGDCVRHVAVDAWTAPAPCEGWTARDVLDHLVTWVPAVLGGAGLSFPAAPSANDDPVGAWESFAGTIQAALDDPEVAGRTFDVGPPGTMTVAAAVDMIVTGDILVHTWDLARATGQDVHLDDELASQMLAGIETMGDALVASGHYGPPAPVAPDASVQDRLVARTGRDPDWSPASGRA